MHKSIFNMVTFGKGGWDYDTVYNLPIYKRNFYMKLLSDVIEKENAKPTASKVPHRPAVK